MAAGIVLTGGSSKMEGVVELAEEIFHMPVSLGIPKHVAGLKDIVRNPVYATGVGLLLYGKQREEELLIRGRGRSSGLVRRVRRWVNENF
jgi:cell division protein FtsA